MTRVNPPPFSFWGPKKKMAVEPSKEKTPTRRPQTAGGYGPKLSCPQTLHPRPQHGRSLAETSEPCAPCRTKRSSGKTLNLTSDYPRAFRFAKRYPGICGDLPVSPLVIARSEATWQSASPVLSPVPRGALNHPIPAPELPGPLQPRPPKRQNALNHRKHPAPGSRPPVLRNRNSPVLFGMVSKGRAAALPLVVGGVWGEIRNPPRIFLRGPGGVFF